MSPKEINLNDVIKYNFNTKDTNKLSIKNFNNNTSLKRKKEFDRNDIINYNFDLKDINKISSFNQMFNKYITERSDLIKYIKKIVNKLKYTEWTFFFCISIFDTIINNIITKSENKIYLQLKLDLILIASLLISGN